VTPATDTQISVQCGGSQWVPNQYVNKRPGCGRLSDGWPTTGNAGEGIWNGVHPAVDASKLASWKPGVTSMFPSVPPPGDAQYFTVFVRLAKPGYVRQFLYVNYGDYLVPVNVSDAYMPVATWWQGALPTIEILGSLALAAFTGPMAVFMAGFNACVSASGIVTGILPGAIFKLAEKVALSYLPK